MGWFCPDDFELNDKSKDFAKKHGLTDDQIADQLEAMRDWEFQRKRTDWDRVFRNWIRKGIEWGQITPVRGLRKVAEVSAEQLQKDRQDWQKEMKERFGLKVVR